MRDELEIRMRAAARGETPDRPTALDESLRALVEQLNGGEPAPTKGHFRIVKDERPRPKSRP
jgi:hypothetical protein